MRAATVTFGELRVRLPRSRMHPCVEQEDLRGPQYCREYLSALLNTEDKLAEFIGFQHHRMGVHCFPGAPVDRISPICDFLQLMTAVDDFLDAVTVEERATSKYRAEMNALMEGISLHEDGPVLQIAQAMSNLISGLLATGMSQGQADRFLADVTTYAEGCLRENRSRLTADIVDLESYRQAHFSGGGQAMSLCILEYSREVDIGPELHTSSRLRAASEYAFWHALLVNSLFSYRKEVFQEDAQTNLITVLTRRQGMSLQAAVDVVCDEIRDAEAAYYRERDEAFDHPFANQPAVRNYLTGLVEFMSGYITVAATHPRYHGTGTWLQEEILAGTMSIYPDHTEFHGTVFNNGS